MGMNYLENYTWSALTREERYFCAALYFKVKDKSRDFARWLIEKARLDLDPSGEWDLGFEVCFYRDLLWHRGQTVRDSDYSPKRTFDLCLFGERAIVIIEAKVCQAFGEKQSNYLRTDKEKLPELLGMKSLVVKAVALASATYFENKSRFKDRGALADFDGEITWECLAAKYGNEDLLRAAERYKGLPKLSQQSE